MHGDKILRVISQLAEIAVDDADSLDLLSKRVGVSRDELTEVYNAIRSDRPAHTVASEPGTLSEPFLYASYVPNLPSFPLPHFEEHGKRAYHFDADILETVFRVASAALDGPDAFGMAYTLGIHQDKLDAATEALRAYFGGTYRS